jgi:hypothetical protein
VGTDYGKSENAAHITTELLPTSNGNWCPLRMESGAHMDRNTQPITSAHANREKVVNNAAASLPSSLPWQPLGWRPITMCVDPKAHTTATLYGNDTAMQVLERGGATVLAYSSGSVLALVTWAQRDDPHWFGGRIPDTPQRVEFVQKAVGRGTDGYRVFEGSALVETHPTAGDAAQRTSFIRNLTPASLP